MAPYYTAGLLLLCVVCCWAKDASVDFRCPKQHEDDLGEKTGYCKLLPQFQGEGHFCVAIEKRQCSEGTCVAEGSVCKYNHDGVIIFFKCESGHWIVGGKPKQQVRRRRGGWWFWKRRTVVYINNPVINKPPVFSSCPAGSIQATAPKSKTKAMATWQIPTASDPERKGVTVELIYGKKPGSEFPAGETVQIYRARDSGGASEYCWFVVKVEVHRCQKKPQYIPHGTYSCSDPSNEDLYGSVCTYSCDSGYKISGPSSVLECQKNQTWDYPMPACAPISCGTPSAMPASFLSCPRGHVYPEVCYVDCQHGYGRLSGASHIRCTENSTWTSTHKCVDIAAPVLNACPPNMQLYSGPLEAPVPLNWTDPVVTDSSNYTVTSDTPIGTLMGPGIKIIRITATDVRGNSKSCNFVVSVQAMTCKQPQRSSNSLLNCTHGYVEGSQCTVTCDPGYVLHGQSATLTCLESQVWDHPAPVCKAVECGNPPVVEFGTFAQVSGSSFNYPSILFLNCEENFDLQGDPYLRCQKNGTWSLPGNCVDNSPPTFPSGCPSAIELYAAQLGEPTTGHWTPPPVEDNSGRNVTLHSSPSPGSAFLPGVTSVTYTATDYKGNSRTCNFFLTVKTLTCPSLTQNYTSGSYLRYICPDKNLYGAVCTTYCTNGFPKEGADNITCELDSSMVYPPTVSWQWDQNFSQPRCIESSCGNLPAPTNGALACYQGSLAKECIMSCSAAYDISASFDGRFSCPNADGIWYPSTVPPCVNVYLPGKTRMMADVYYFTDSCPQSLDEIKQNFVTAITGLFPDACTDLPDICVEDNIQVTCGTTRRKKSIPKAVKLCLRNNLGNIGLCRLRQRRSSAQSYMRITFAATINCDDGVIGRDEAFQKCTEMETNFTMSLKSSGDSGHLNIGTSNIGTQYSTNSHYIRTEFQLVCRPGTMFKRRIDSTKLGCVGCSKGKFLAINSTQCQQCPVGTYTELDNATDCTDCPPGWSTPTTGSTSSLDCQELCQPGHFSEDGFVPCQPCPPGQFQANARATSCDLCPASTWTSGAATGLEQCLSADAHLSNNTSLLAQSSNAVSALTLVLHVFLADVAVSNVTFTFVGSSYDPVSVFLYSHSNLTSFVPPDSSSSVSRQAEPNTWMGLVLSADPSSRQINIKLGSASIFTRSTTPTASMPPADVTVISTEGKVLVGGLYGEEGVNNITTPSSTSNDCNGNSSTNLLTWTLPVTSLQFPSTCDAVDECQSSPCSIHGVCINQQGGYLCQCHDGWHGLTCHQPPDACYQHQCQNGATCLPQGSNFTCVCTENFSGTLCELTKVHGGFGDWSVWSNCSSPCDGEQRRYRLCDNPEPQNDGDNCNGDYEQIQSCGSTSCPVDGGWSAWTPWSACSASCGIGTVKTRKRVCDNPAPQFSGDPCEGVTEETTDCVTNECAVNGNWSPWSSWTECTVSCGGGVTMHQRSCTDPAPQFGGLLCTGRSMEMVTCNVDPCPECSRLPRTRSVVLNCDNTVNPKPDPVTCDVTCASGFVANSNQAFPQLKCGPSTGYLWNDQFNSSSKLILPECTIPMTSEAVNLKSCLYTETPCRNSDTITVRMNTEIPCETEGCWISSSAKCGGGCQNQPFRQKRSTQTLTLNIQMNMEMGNSTDFNGSDITTAQQYINRLTVADQSARLLTGNQTDSLFTVAVNGKDVQLDQPTSVYSVSMQCPPGYTNTSYYCVACPKGSMETSGQCILCPVGQYQDQPGSTTCKSCPAGYTWDLPGANDVTKCVFAVEVAPVLQDDTIEDEEDDAVDIGLIAGATVGALTILIVAVVLAVIYLKPKLCNKQNNYYRRRSSVEPFPLEPRRPSSIDMWVHGPLEVQLPPIDSTSA